jgi:hypothetical protein
MTTTQRDAITDGAANGLLVFNTTNRRFNYRHNTGAGDSSWRVLMAEGLTTKTYAPTVNIDFNDSRMQTLSLTGDVSFTTSNLRPGSDIKVRIIADGTSRTFTFPAGWKIIGASSITGIAANHTGVLTVESWGTSDADVTASWLEQVTTSVNAGANFTINRKVQ